MPRIALGSFGSSGVAPFCIYHSARVAVTNDRDDLTIASVMTDSQSGVFGPVPLRCDSLAPGARLADEDSSPTDYPVDGAGGDDMVGGSHRRVVADDFGLAYTCGAGIGPGVSVFQVFPVRDKRGPPFRRRDIPRELDCSSACQTSGVGGEKVSGGRLGLTYRYRAQGEPWDVLLVQMG